MKIYGTENNLFILKELGERIKDIRIAKSLTREQLAENTCISLSTLVRIESGKGVNMENYLAVLRGLGLLQNFDLLIPEQKQSLEDIYHNKPKRVRASKKRQEEEFQWGEDKV